ncbi:putative RNA binding protein YcfA (HicA-like mRNA interferase family) [Dinghuibacter silviterrae]|uniref:Putative RNA binding protein YcfA (HicA-like mRNA interferase family) n=1 Tax=Dinghuibacter silviterrae TaxID=1539049 RepID=A0A4R8DRH7_9BACT|nr:putative RNA binding protein YcfA (HicA-like mRNA interferase family) [Dinghuibacter silviterrae]
MDASDLIKILKRFGYAPTRQTGSHIRLTTDRNGQHHITIPNHTPIKVGTLNAILSEVSMHLGISKEAILS